MAGCCPLPPCDFSRIHFRNEEVSGSIPLGSTNPTPLFCIAGFVPLTQAATPNRHSLGPHRRSPAGCVMAMPVAL
jgi:hypothetical protein